MLLASEIEEEYNVKGRWIDTPSGRRAIKTVYKTIPLPIYELTLEDGKVLQGSQYHLVSTYAGCVHLFTITPGTKVNTVDGVSAAVSVINTGRVESLYDITIDDANALFYTNGIVSHNSTTFAARQIINAHLYPKMSSLYVAPYHHQVQTYAYRYHEMEIDFREHTGKQHVYRKRYANGSNIEMVNCLTTPETVRGKTVDELLFDESQSMDPDIISEIKRVQTTSEMPSLIYSGTARGDDTLLEQQWQESSQGVWMLRAGDDKTWLDMHDPDTLFKICSASRLGPLCPITGKLLDMRKGVYSHTNRAALNAGLVGLHVPQCMIHDLVKDPVQWGKIYNLVTRESRSKILMECFGIATSNLMRELSEPDLQRICVLKDTPEQLREKAFNGYYRKIISGCDWGGSDYNPADRTKTSYTVHCIIGLAPDNKIDILHYRRYDGMMYEEISEDIVQMHKAWNGHLIATDFGVGLAYNTYVRNRVDYNTHYVFGYTTPTSPPVSRPATSTYMNHLSINRTEAITNVFADIKAETPRIRAQSWDLMMSYLKDFTAMSRIPSENVNGTTTFRYIRAATKPDDALHALTFAYTLMMLYLEVPLVKDEALAKQLRIALRNSTAGNQGYTTEYNPDEFNMNTNYIISV